MSNHPSNRPTVDDLEALFTYHPPTDEQRVAYGSIREDAKTLAGTILACCPPSADTSAAIRKLREAVMSANAAIALDPPEPPKLARA